MNSLELNKIAASILVAGLIAMVVGNATDFIYKPNISNYKRGYKINVAETKDAASEAAEPELKPEEIMKIIKAGNEENGKVIAKKCSICHNFANNGGNGVGPNLWNVVNRPKGHVADFSYSKAMQEKGGNWVFEDLFHFLKSPRNFVAGTKMSFIGLNKPQDIADVIAYLRSLSDNPAALP